MYADPRHIRKHTVKLSLNDQESELLESLAIVLGEQKSSLARDLLIARLEELDQRVHAADRPAAQPHLQRAA